MKFKIENLQSVHEKKNMEVKIFTLTDSHEIFRTLAVSKLYNHPKNTIVKCIGIGNRYSAFLARRPRFIFFP